MWRGVLLLVEADGKMEIQCRMTKNLVHAYEHLLWVSTIPSPGQKYSGIHVVLTAVYSPQYYM